jgi:hypothetical protein
VNEKLNLVKIGCNDNATFENCLGLIVDKSGKLWITGGMILRGETEVLREMIIPVPLCPPQVPYELVWI